MPQAKLQRSPRKDKKWMVKYKNKKTGRTNTIHGGDLNAKGKPNTPKAKAFLKRHGSKTKKQEINRAIWKGKKIGDTVRF